MVGPRWGPCPRRGAGATAEPEVSWPLAALSLGLVRTSAESPPRAELRWWPARPRCERTARRAGLSGPALPLHWEAPAGPGGSAGRWAPLTCSVAGLARGPFCRHHRCFPVVSGVSGQARVLAAHRAVPLARLQWQRVSSTEGQRGRPSGLSTPDRRGLVQASPAGAGGL